jgi:DNA polymerase (family 10)
MDTKEVVKVLEDIAMLLELSGENPFKTRTYTNVARALEQHDEPVGILVEEKRLRDIKGLGEALEQKIEELVTTGSLGYYENLRSQFPETLFELTRIPGLGAKRVKQVYSELEITSLDELQTACEDGRLDGLKGFGKKLQAKILEGIAFAQQHSGQYRFDVAAAAAHELLDHLSAHPSVIRIELAGSLRRHKEVIKDVDILASSNDPEALMQHFVDHPEVQTITGQGSTKSSIVLKSGIGADLRVVVDAQFPFALCHFTGSKDHNVVMRQRAKERGLKLNEYGLFEGETCVPCETEADVFEKLGLPYLPPEVREDTVEFSFESTPALVERDDLVGVFHCHSTYSDGADTLNDMALATRERGYAYLAICDHSQSAAYAGGLRPKRIQAQQKEIEKLNAEFGNFRILKGIESDIRTDGSLDYDEDVLKTFEVIVASVHSKLDMTEEEATARIVKAVENPYTTILGHPTGRLLLQREGYSLDFEKVMDACLANNVAIEINGSCYRLDLDWRHVRRAKEKGLKLCIGPDAHRIAGLDQVQYGLGIARKGFLEAGDLLNTMTVEEFFAWRSSS